MQYVFRYNLKPAKISQYQHWLADHRDAGSQRGGWTYQGTWFDLMGFGLYDYESRWELDDQRPFASPPLDCDGGRRVSERLEFVEDGEIYLIKPVG